MLPYMNSRLKLGVLEKRGVIDEERAALVGSWPHSGFGTHAARVIQPGSRHELESILQYMERAPVLLERLTFRPDGMVHYQANYHLGLGRNHQLVTGVERLPCSSLTSTIATSARSAIR